MIRDCGRWHFDGIYYENHNESYPAIRESMRILMENLISSKILIPKRLTGGMSLEYDTVDELLDQVEAFYLKDASEFDIEGDTIMYTPNGEQTSSNLVSIENFRISEQHFVFVVKTDYWLPMTMISEVFDFKWNLELYKLNYFRIPIFLKRLDKELGWENEELLLEENWFVSTQAGYDFFLRESMITRAYEENPNPDFDLNAYVDAIKMAKEQHSR
ncbi:hypothetical protein [Chitinophaga sp. S165]|uniref:hypothetical protein n=1 Tax=Chitinophaga sp. S165 TaxID=2135462 RepID=UPI000D714D6C|nr:hypothetical protein [Chitinophaga sp. S165]PWV48780.1 hypothetical protein C7475_10621 [Chitinophaga sp. S165]